MDAAALFYHLPSWSWEHWAVVCALVLESAHKKKVFKDALCNYIQLYSLTFHIFQNADKLSFQSYRWTSIW